jgi:predicted CXXCH cytochrome family protein
MANPHRLLVSLFIALGLMGAALGVTLEPHVAKGEIKVIFPPDRAALPCGEFDVIALAERATLEVDGRAQQWEAFAPPLRVAKVKLAPGQHELRIGTRQVKFAVNDKAEKTQNPPGWDLYRSHPIRDEQRCAACHRTSQRDGQTVVGEPHPTTSCLECHTTIDFEAKHSHPLEPLKPCSMCHALHGSPRPSLLKAPVKKLCAECHES